MSTRAIELRSKIRLNPKDILLKFTGKFYTTKQKKNADR